MFALAVLTLAYGKLFFSSKIIIFFKVHLCSLKLLLYVVHMWSVEHFLQMYVYMADEPTNKDRNGRTAVNTTVSVKTVSLEDTDAPKGII